MTRVAELRAAAGGLPEHEVWRLVTVATGKTRAELALDPDVSPIAVLRFEELAKRRRDGEPLQYLEGTVQFGPLELLIDRRALVPRPETEQLWELVTRRAGTPLVVVDLCTGSGNLALALKHAYPKARVVATERSAAAAQLARENAAYTGHEIEVVEGDLFAPLPDAIRGRVDVLVANPPYLAKSEVRSLPTDVRDHEPHDALVAGVHGDEVLARIAEEAIGWLRPGGLLAVEISEFSGKRCLRLFSRYGAELLPDLTGRDRFVVGRRPADHAERLR